MLSWDNIVVEGVKRFTRNKIGEGFTVVDKSTNSRAEKSFLPLNLCELSVGFMAMAYE